MARVSEESKARNREKARVRAAIRKAADPDLIRERGRRTAEKRRRARGVPPLSEYLAAKLKPAANHDSHVRKWAQMMARRLALAATGMHDAHVKRWRYAKPADHFRHYYRNDPEFNARYKLRARLRKLKTIDGDIAASLSNFIKKGTMLKRWQALLGYKMQDLVAHLVRTLPKGSTWDDFMQGRLHIDHILPRSSFDLTKPDEVKACWCLSNLRLLWASDNIRKGARVEFLL